MRITLFIHKISNGKINLGRRISIRQFEMAAPEIHTLAACDKCNSGIHKDVSVIFSSLFCAVALRAGAAQAGAAVKAL